MLAGEYQVNVGGHLYPAIVHLRPPFDPAGHRVKGRYHNSSLCKGYLWDRQVIGTKSRHPDNAEFVRFRDATSTRAQNYIYAVFAPNGIPTNEVMAEQYGQVVLAAASGAKDQKWYFNGTGWTNVATGDVLESTTDNGPILAATGPSSRPSETWTSVTP